MKKVKMLQISFLIILFCGSFACSAQTKNEEPAQKKTAALSEKSQSDEIIKCSDDDIDCFIKAAGNCQKASYTRRDSADFGENIFIKHDYFEIKSGTANECRLYTKVLKWEAVPNEKYLEELKKRGEKPREVDKEMKEISDNRMKKMTGTDGICTFTSEKLVALLNRWKKGSFSTSDYSGAKCEGTYFVPENGFTKGF